MVGIIELLAINTGMDTGLVERIMVTAPVRYKTYFIPKRHGGLRKISQPALEVKVLQRALIEVLLNELPVHDAATAYRTGMSIKDNALRHAGHGPIMKMDFKEFFPSIFARDWDQYCETTEVLTEPREIYLTTRLMFQRPRDSSLLRLAIGAPSSPVLSNALLFEFDEMLTAEVAKDHVVYTRYADDLTFSAPRTGHLVNVEKAVRTVIKAIRRPKLTINEDKTQRITTKFGRHVTGLTLTNDGEVSVGHERKRQLHAAVHRALHGKLDVIELGKLKGILGFVNSAEPEFIVTLRKKYGSKIIDSIQKTPVPLRPRPFKK
ncbi:MULTISPECIES: retron St85 family RNA-directed DNA polymerase [unclassified Mesorhizobium]|uniref:retron St85 family RNA-directed DNA polymerase n=1 Tax=unclassified Mesorhizobium TaxID=325217 RepID=UPI000FDBC134|nr:MULTISPECIES: retron St85 family RNA-directed DNA polymerase [unclassified Mesorhizobium]TGR47387.1 RNA-directed DNA polymerase [bacterium M00.F.Ca.ET.199.01.1.1]TGU36840.1 RNA-directed DNA polymerase [bacterium M00.F.Ca.ET.156.01.1.1]TGV88028.1 RNA-directed DNA polymerase [Mesorhizobium sp. M00.F.Ca.ET.149.01.1.1]TGR29100.1 RNA-directed DNA polymerase [Mesorhizobium sp. M8A.F.Ca.ET.202.01.1.1]TGR29675.1 RNA-directed DNA polymerase [Mesorhizobium sp. M8A.F.Ca.ET.197.01.1.1]